MTSHLGVFLTLVLFASLSRCQQPPPPSSTPAPQPPQPSAQPAVALPQQPSSDIETTTPPPSIANTTDNEVSTCFYESASTCANITGFCRCRALAHTPGAVLCCDLDSEYTIKKGLSESCLGVVPKAIERLHLRNVTAPVLDLGQGHWDELESLQHLAVTDGAVKVLQGRLKTEQLRCLNLSANALTQLPALSVTVERFSLDISGNNGLPCHSILELMKQLKNSSVQLNFAHNAQTYCLSSQSFHWFNTTERVPLAQVEVLNSLEEQCPEGPTGRCKCNPAGIDMIAGRSPTFSIKADCSGRGLTELPRHLPPHTIMLNVSDNHISNLTALSVNPEYKEIRQFFADNNTITSIVPLEGSQFIENFVELSLRSNNISVVPTYILSNVFDRNWESRTVNLGQNRLKCDCSTAQTVKIWLINHQKHIHDFNEVLCENMEESVVELDQNKICAVQSDWTDYIYYIIAGEVALLLILIAKVSYDYWVFKTAGYLPWPASKMPKLPCDWVFE